MQALWGYEGINGKLAEGNTAHIFAPRPKIIQLGKFGAGYSRNSCSPDSTPRAPVTQFVFLTGFLTTSDCSGFVR